MKCGLFYSKYDWHLEVKLTRDLKNRHFALLTDEYYSRHQKIVSFMCI